MSLLCLCAAWTGCFDWPSPVTISPIHFEAYQGEVHYLVILAPRHVDFSLPLPEPVSRDASIPST